MPAPAVDALFGFRVGDSVRIMYRKPGYPSAPYAGRIIALHGSGIGKRGRLLENRLTLWTERGERSFVESGIDTIDTDDTVVTFER